MSDSVALRNGPRDFKKSKTSPLLNPPINNSQEVPESDHTCNYDEIPSFSQLPYIEDDTLSEGKIRLPISRITNDARDSKIRLLSPTSHIVEDDKDNEFRLLYPTSPIVEDYKYNEFRLLYPTSPIVEEDKDSSIQLSSPISYYNEGAQIGHQIKELNQVSYYQEEVPDRHHIEKLNPVYYQEDLQDRHQIKQLNQVSYYQDREDRRIPSYSRLSPYQDAQNRHEILSYILISQFTDYGQDFEIKKPILDTNSIKSLFGICTTDLQILGLYGDSEICYNVAKTFLEAEDVPKIEAEDALVCLYSTKYSRAVIIYLTSPGIYDEKPLKSNSSSILFVRYLLDLCPTVVACPSKYTLDNWYISDEPGQENPYSPMIHVSGTINIIKEEVEESDFIKLKVKSFLDSNLNTCITADGSSAFYQYDFTKPDGDEIAERFDELLHNSVNSNIRDLIDNPGSRYEFFKRLDEDVAELLRDTQLRIRIGVVGLKEVVGFIEGLKKRIDDCKCLAIEEFKRKISDFKFKSVVTKFLISKSRFEDKLSELCIEMYNISAYDINLSEELFIKYLKPFLEDEDIEEKSRLLCSILDECLDKVQRANSMLKVEELANNIKIIIKKHTKGLEEAYKTTCKLSRYTIDHNPDSNKIMIGSSGETFMLKPKFGQGILKQMIQMGNFCYALFASNGLTYIFKLIRTRGSRLQVEECSTIPDDNCFIAWGSDLRRFILFQNTNKIAYYGSVGQSRNFDRGIPLPVYSDRDTVVVSAVYLSKQNKLVYIDQKGLLYYCDITPNNQLIVPVKDETVSALAGSDEEGNSYLKPKTGSTFLEVQSSESEDILFIRTQNAIELYDSNFMYLKHIETGSGFKGFKTMFDDGLYYIVLFQKRIKCLTYQAAHESKKIENNTKRRIKIPGNPMPDLIHQSIKKCGDSKGPLNHKTKVYFKVNDEEEKEKVESYLNSLECMHESVEFKGTIRKRKQIRKLKRKHKPIKPKDFEFALCNRVPLHIAALENGNLYPMQNGLNNIENIINSLDKRADFRVSLAEELQFGHYEYLLSNLKDIKVISIIGRQSSGKSYLMNRIFGTRFSVAAHRCTHGIWMSLAKIKKQNFIVLDCEGLFSMERTFQEEMKLCMMLSAISDYVILNQDLTFNRTLVQLFEKFAHGVDRINGSKLFKGKLEIAVRDVGEGEDMDAMKQLQDFITTITERGQDSFLINLFSGHVNYSFFNNFENQHLFNECIEKAKRRYLSEIEPRWHSGKELLDTMKTSLISIMTDNDSSIDKDLFKLKMKQVMHNFEELADGSAKDKQYTYIYIREVTIYYITREVSVDIYEMDIDKASPIRPFDNLFLSNFPIEIKLKYHNLWHQALNEYIQGFFIERSEELLNKFSDEIPNYEETEDMKRDEIDKAKKILKDQTTQYSLCLRSCSECSQACVLQDMHTSTCSCETDHKCKHPCSYCSDDLITCSFNAGHEGEAHACAKESHVCGKKCRIERCKDKCKLKPKHRERCNCLNIHECMKKCKMHDDCKQYCKIDILEPHGDNHSCLQARCPKQCYFGDGNCASTDHLHDLSPNISKIVDPATRRTKHIHLCGNEHKCEFKCEKKGICAINENCQTRTWASNNSEFTYQHFEIMMVRKECNIKINKDSIKHPGPHICDEKIHRCDIRCPDCGTFCKKPYGHLGLHSSNMHRNKVKCVFISQDSQFNQEIHSIAKRTTTMHTFNAGESAKPEFCYESCISKGRGHTHPIECRGGNECAQHKYPGYAIHSTESFYPDLNKRYDLLSCSKYWYRFGWKPPVVSNKKKETQVEFGKCNFFCNHPSHSNEETKHFCTQNLFHSSSSEYSIHTFECVHQESEMYDLCFVLDCTGSMRPSFSQLIRSITEIISRWSSQVSIKAAIVCYTDHHPHNGFFPVSNPVKLFPSSKNLNDAYPREAINFISRLRASDGGNNGGEAMIDGLNEASLLRFRPGSHIITFIIGDEPPHGREFSTSSPYQRTGCPCGIDWKIVFNRMKNMRIELKFIKLNEIVNRTIRKFNKEYDRKMEVLNLSSMEEIGPEVALTVSRTIQRNMEFSRS